MFLSGNFLNYTQDRFPIFNTWMVNNFFFRNSLKLHILQTFVSCVWFDLGCDSSYFTLKVWINVGALSIFCFGAHACFDMAMWYIETLKVKCYFTSNRGFGLLCPKIGQSRAWYTFSPRSTLFRFYQSEKCIN